MSTVNGPLPPRPMTVHLPNPADSSKGLCGDRVLAPQVQLTNEIRATTCMTCLWTLHAVLLKQTAEVAATLATAYHVALPR